MKKGKMILLCVFALSICVIFGIFLGRNLPGHYILPFSSVPNDIESAQVKEPNDDAEEVVQDMGPLNLNTATQSQLMELPGIGEVLAQRIIDYRQINGPYTSTDDLLDVNGIGEKKLSQIEPYVNVGG